MCGEKMKVATPGSLRRNDVGKSGYISLPALVSFERKWGGRTR